MLMTSENFNPAFYVKQDSNGEKYLPTHALMMWLNATRPGWRVTSDGIKIIRMTFADPTGSSRERYLGVGHVAVVNSKGVRVVSVPVSTQVSSPDFAAEMFDEGARLALETLGYNIMNISHSQWNEVNSWRAGATAPKKQGGLLSTIKDSIFGEGQPAHAPASPPPLMPEPIAPPFSLVGAGEDGLELGPGVERPDESVLFAERQAAMATPDMDRDEVYARDLFEKVCAKNPAIKSKFNGSFEKLCLSVNGFSWVEADNNEKTKILDKLNLMAKR